MSKFVGSFGSISGLDPPQPIHLDFRQGWGVGSVFTWYRGLSNPGAHLIDKIQIWKRISTPVPHRFIVVHMCDKSVHRFDRRPDPGLTNTVDLISNQAVASQDAYQSDVSIKQIEESAVCEIELHVGAQVDLMTVLSTCYAISEDTLTQKYSFLRYNCFFFSWTILMVVARRCLPYQLPQAETVICRFNKEINPITEFLLHEFIDFFRDLIVEVLTIFRNKAGNRLHVGMSPLAKITWSLPVGFIRFFWRRIFSLRLYLGWRKQLASKFQTELKTAVQRVGDALQSMERAQELLDEHLWIDDAKDPLKEAIKKESIKLVWKSVLEAVSAGLGDFTPEEFAAELAISELKFSLRGRNAAQYTAVWNASLHGGLQAVKGVGERLDGTETHEVAFEKAWNAARNAARHAAQTVVRNTSNLMKQPGRDEMWQVVWEIWDDCWDEVHKIVQPRSVQNIERVIERLISSGVIATVQDMKQSRGRTIEIRTPDKESTRLLGIHHQPRRYVTNAELQKYMHNMIEQDTIGASTLKEVHTAMGRVWRATLQPLPLPSEVLEVETGLAAESVMKMD
ncbi:hypothetical protein RhiLY_12126 [Ceratobasidium sp. AG-Ba]|nr:hypothetical protein RhiLY_12126 [Ceratobasidium sp. AG-Ba]